MRYIKAPLWCALVGFSYKLVTVVITLLCARRLPFSDPSYLIGAYDPIGMEVTALLQRTAWYAWLNENAPMVPLGLYVLIFSAVCFLAGFLALGLWVAGARAIGRVQSSRRR